MKIKAAAGYNLPLSQAQRRQKGVFVTQLAPDGLIVRKWPRPRPVRSQAQLEQEEEFKALVRAVKSMTPAEVTAAHEISEGSKYTWRDILSRVVIGRLFDMPGLETVLKRDIPETYS